MSKDPNAAFVDGAGLAAFYAVNVLVGILKEKGYLTAPDAKGVFAGATNTVRAAADLTTAPEIEAALELLQQATNAWDKRSQQDGRP